MTESDNIEDQSRDATPRYEVVRGGKVVRKSDDRETARELGRDERRTHPNEAVSVRDTVTGDSEPID